MGRKRIGLISLHYKHNYGTMLQAFALQKKLELLGHEAQYIDYRHPMPKLPLEKCVIHRLKKLPKNFIDLPKHIKMIIYANKMSLRHKHFDDFYCAKIKTNETRYYSEEELILNCPSYDIYIVGSDQVWNPNLSFYCGVYFLRFVSDRKKKAAYAPSIGLSVLSAQQSAEMVEHLKKFTYLSCREQTGAVVLSKLCGKTVLQVVDPTLLLDASVWSKEAVDPKIEEPFILCYFLGEVKWQRDFVTRLEKQTGLRAYFIPNTYLDVNKNNAVFEVGPAEFIGLIKNANYVCTDSFHGCVFSAIFERQLYGFCKRAEVEMTSDNSRLADLFQLLGVPERLIKKPIEGLLDVTDIDYSMVKPKLIDAIQRSELYLNEVLQLLSSSNILS